ncbi:MAG: hypothetical protein GY756_09870 [bacterium]|nr:hypothetical protein [bacterium]
MKIEDAIKEYQCTGCVAGEYSNCYVKNTEDHACDRHCLGTMASGIGKIYLGMPKGFCRKGSADLNMNIYKKYKDSNWTYNKLNIPVWKYLDEHGNTLVKGICPRLNSVFIHIFLEDCLKEISCLEITKSDIDGMD